MRPLPTPSSNNSPGHTPYDLSQQRTFPLPAATPIPFPLNPLSAISPPASIRTRKRLYSRIIVVALILLLGIGIYFVWRSSSASPSSPSATITQQQFGTTPNASSLPKANGTFTTTASGTIQVYVIGAVQHPGVYTLPAGARVYQLLQAAGGTLPNANLVALNLAAKLSDGQEVYVLAIGETPPTYAGGVPGPGSTGSSGTTGLVNINTASATELQTNLHVSSTTAQNIVNYRVQHGPYTSIDQLLNVVSKSIYNKIKTMLTL